MQRKMMSVSRDLSEAQYEALALRQVKVPSGLVLTCAVARAAEARRMLNVVFMVMGFVLCE